MIPLLIAYFGFNVLLGFFGVISYVVFVAYQLYLSRATGAEKSHDPEAGVPSDTIDSTTDHYKEKKTLRAKVRSH